MDCQLYEFLYINENKTWTEAQQYCREKHTDLVTVTNMKDMKRLINISAGNKKEAWIGLYDQTHGTRTWYWSQSEVDFNESETNWNPSTSEPSDSGGVENCGFMWKTLKWGDLSCNDRYIFLCYSETNESKTFHLIQEEKTWLEAQSYCRQNHTDLVSGTKQLQDQQLKNVCSSLGQNQYILNGLFRDTWRWSDGSSFSFRHWNLQFNNQRFNSGQCAMTVFDDGGRWKNVNCAERKPFICYDDKVILVKENMNWSKALNHCRTHHHDLVTITNMDEQRWIQEKVKNASTDYVWMGLRFNCTLNFWFWVCPGMTTFNISDGATDDCNISGCMDVRGQHRWFNKNATEEFNFICKI
ncbi:PREDICTED: C-type mannose receptor 2-like [Poecilia mexicana]|uniref:C-type mannose receptor 2-like n=1 Tax=Poecilia mexicana TaxID=48701 RepID=UPI00072E20DB|nr:PREDICTED: C-type mannose receptor 2-like [Poecilia mexicana]